MDVKGRLTANSLLAVAGSWALAGLLAAPPSARAFIFADGFESGDTSAWSVTVGLAPDAFRFSDLDLRDPHVFAEVEIIVPLCLDVTDDPVLDFSFNQTLEDQLSQDGDDDGFLDASLLALFRPLDLAASGERVDVRSGVCTAPAESAVCAEDPTSPPLVTTYDAADQGICMETLPGTTSGYTPAIDEPLAPCFVSVVETLVLDLDGVMVTLQDAQVAASFDGDPPEMLVQGLLRGFLSEADADAILLPPTFPIVGGQPLSVLLPGGTGNCASGDDRDQHMGESGWWFYFNFSATRVPYLSS